MIMSKKTNIILYKLFSFLVLSTSIINPSYGSPGVVEENNEPNKPALPHTITPDDDNFLTHVNKKEWTKVAEHYNLSQPESKNGLRTCLRDVLDGEDTTQAYYAACILMDEYAELIHHYNKKKSNTNLKSNLEDYLRSHTGSLSNLQATLNLLLKIAREDENALQIDAMQHLLDLGNNGFYHIYDEGEITDAQYFVNACDEILRRIVRTPNHPKFLPALDLCFSDETVDYDELKGLLLGDQNHPHCIPAAFAFLYTFSEYDNTPERRAASDILWKIIRDSDHTLRWNAIKLISTIPTQRSMDEYKKITHPLFMAMLDNASKETDLFQQQEDTFNNVLWHSAHRNETDPVHFSLLALESEAKEDGKCPTYLSKRENAAPVFGYHYEAIWSSFQNASVQGKLILPYANPITVSPFTKIDMALILLEEDDIKTQMMAINFIKQAFKAENNEEQDRLAAGVFKYYIHKYCNDQEGFSKLPQKKEISEIASKAHSILMDRAKGKTVSLLSILDGSAVNWINKAVYDLYRSGQGIMTSYQQKILKLERRTYGATIREE